MELEKIYRIPKNLNGDYALFGRYTIPDVLIVFLLFAAGSFSAIYLHVYVALVPSVVYALLRLRILDNYPLSFWLKAALRFLLLQSSRHSEYTLFEKGGDWTWK